MPHSTQTIAIHDYFGIRGGGERLVLTLAKALHTSLAYGYRTDQTYDRDMFPIDSVDLGLTEPLRRPGLRALALSFRFSLEQRRVSSYPTRIFSGVVAPFSAPKADGGRNIFYCHTPPRFLYDKKTHFAPMTSGLGAGVKRAALEQFRRRYESSIERMDTIVANSVTVQERIKSFLGRDSIVVYPPCDIDAYTWGGQQDFYLSTARLTGLKRVDRIVKAFLKLPNHNLVVASQGDELEALKRLADNAPNIKFFGWVDEDALRSLIGQAIATIYIPVDEDFGMSPVESMAAGKPVIGVAEGGLRETIVHGETGILLPPDFTVDHLKDAIAAMTPQRAATMRQACEARAGVFTEARFVADMAAIVRG